ncbi:MAG: serine hydrolase [Pseudomonadota bacterium]
MLRRSEFLGVLASIGCPSAWAQGSPGPAEWQLAAPEQHGFDAGTFPAVRRRIVQELRDIASVVVVRNGLLVFEHYRPGSDADTLRDVQSVTKSVVSALVGVALQENLLRDIEQPIAELLPEAAVLFQDARAGQVTLRHILGFTAGFEPESTMDRWARRLGGGGTLRRALGRPLVAAPGERFSYDNTTAYIASAALARAAKQSASKYAESHLFQPLGIARYEWPADSDGNNPPHAGLHLRTRDMAKLGQLFLDLGRWGERQLIPAPYAAAATSRQSAGGPPAQSWAYGYFWWVVPSGAARSPFLANGLGGQFIHVDPASRTVVAITADPSQASNARGHSLALLRSLLPTTIALS